MVEENNLPIIVSTHPRTLKAKTKNTKLHSLVKTLNPFNFTDYINLQINSKAVLSDSGTISEEASILNFPAINLREAHERPEATEEASIIMTGFNTQRVLQALKILSSQERGEKRSLKMVRDYDVLNVSDKVVRIIHSYTDYVNRVVWKKY